MGSLFEVAAEFKQIMAMAEQEATNSDGEITDTMADSLEASQMALDEKIDNIIKYVKNLRADAESYNKIELEFSARKKSAEKKALSLEAYLKHAGVTKYESLYGVIKTTTSQAVEVAPMAEIPAKYQNIKENITPNKAALKVALKAGKVFDGIELVQREKVSVK